MRKTVAALFLFCAFSVDAQLVPFRINSLWGYSDTAGNLVISPIFDQADFFDGPIAFVKKDSLFFGINQKGEKSTPYLKRYGKFSSGLCPVVQENGKSAYMDRSGRIIIDGNFDAAENFSEGLAVVSSGKKLGIIDSLGQWVRKPEFDASSITYRSGFLMASKGSLYYYIDRRGNLLNLPDTVQPAGIFSEGLAAVYVHKPHLKTIEIPDPVFLEFMDTAGRIALSGFVSQGFDYSPYIEPEKEFRDGKAIIKVRNEIGYDYYFVDYKRRLSPLYASARHLGDSLFLGAIGYYMSDIRIVDSNYYVMGQFQQKPTQVGEFGNGLLPFRNKDGNWGYVNSNCRLMIESKYSAAFNFVNGYAWVVLNGKPGIISVSGREYFYDKP